MFFHRNWMMQIPGHMVVDKQFNHPIASICVCRNTLWCALPTSSPYNFGCWIGPGYVSSSYRSPVNLKDCHFTFRNLKLKRKTCERSKHILCFFSYSYFFSGDHVGLSNGIKCSALRLYYVVNTYSCEHPLQHIPRCSPVFLPTNACCIPLEYKCLIMSNDHISLTYLVPSIVYLPHRTPCQSLWV